MTEPQARATPQSKMNDFLRENDYPALISDGLHVHHGHYEQTAESPISKRLLQERGSNQNLTEASEPIEVSVKLMERPQSKGNDFEAPRFAPGPTHTKDTRSFTHLPNFNFAPVRCESSVVKKDTLIQGQDDIHNTRSSPERANSPCTPCARRVESLPKSTELAAPVRNIANIITISSDQIENTVEFADPATREPNEVGSERSVPPEDALNGDTRHDKRISRGASADPAHDNPAEKSQPQLGDAADSQPGTQIQSLPKLNEKVRHDGNAHTRSSSVLSTTAGVAKRTSKSKEQRYDKQFVESSCSRPDVPLGVPSEEDLLYVLMHRSRQKGAEAKVFRTKIKTLQHRVFELHVENKNFCQERDNVLAAHSELSQSHDLLQLKLEDFSTKYYKLKDFARSTHNDFVALREESKKQDDAVRELKQQGQRLQTSAGLVHTGLHDAQVTLKSQIRDLAAVRSTKDQVFSRIDNLSSELESKSTRIKELKRDNERLQAHIVRLEQSQQRANQASRDVSQELSSALAKVVSRLDGIECSALQPPDFPDYHDAIEQCSNLVRTLHEKKQIPVADFERLSESVSALENTISRGVESIASELQSLRGPKHIAQQDFFEHLKQYVEDLQLSTLHVQHSNAERIRLEERLKASEVLMQQLRKSTEQAESHAATFQKAVESTMNASNAQPKKVAHLEQQIQEAQLRWNQAKSDLAKVQQEVTVGNQVQSDIARSKQNYERMLSEKTQDFHAKIREKTTALEQAQSAKKDADQAYAILVQEVETVQKSYSALESEHMKTKSDAKKLRQDYEEVKGQLETTSRKLEHHDQLKAQLQKIQSRCNTATEEAAELRGTQSQLHTLQQQFNSLETDGKMKSLEVTALREKLNELEKYPAVVEQLKQDMYRAQHQEEDLRKKLDEAATRAAQVDDLRSELQSERCKVEKLKMEVTSAWRKGQQLGSLAEEKAHIEQELTVTKNDLEVSRKQLQEKANVEQQVHELKAEVARLAQLANRSEDLSQQLNGQIEEIHQKKAQIASLRVELEKIKGESQVASTREEEVGGEELTGITSQQSHISFLDPPISQSVNHLPGNASENQQRKIADRSVLQKSAVIPGNQAEAPPQGSQPGSTNSTDMVPDSQLDKHLPGASNQQIRQTADVDEPSPLSSADSNFDSDDTSLDNAEDTGATEPEIPETLQHVRAPLQAPPASQDQFQMLPEPGRIVARPSSSALSEDLFRSHATNTEEDLCVNKMSSPLAGNPAPSQTTRGYAYLPSVFPSTVAPRDLHTHPPSVPSLQRISPRHLRSGTQLRERLMTPDLQKTSVADSQSSMSPPPQRNHHLPNSAVKRKTDGDSPQPKRLVRHPENLSVREPMAPTTQMVPTSIISKTGAPTQRRGSNLGGTSATASGKPPKGSKSARKGSRSDKYTAKFNVK